MPPQPGMGPPQPGMGMPPQNSMGSGMPPQPGMGPGMPPQPGMGQGMPSQPGMGPGMGQGMPPQPGMGHGMGPGPGYMNNGGQQSRKGLDPDSMPNPIQVMADDRANHPTGQFVTNERGKVPPLVTTPFTTVDQGNSGPGLVRATMYSVPDSPDMKKQTSVPLGLVMSPLAEPKPGEYPVP